MIPSCTILSWLHVVISYHRITYRYTITPFQGPLTPDKFSKGENRAFSPSVITTSISLITLSVHNSGRANLYIQLNDSNRALGMKQWSAMNSFFCPSKPVPRNNPRFSLFVFSVACCCCCTLRNKRSRGCPSTPS